MIIKNMWFIMRFQKSKMEYFTKNVIASKKELDLCSDEEQHQKNQPGEHGSDGVVPDMVLREV